MGASGWLLYVVFAALLYYFWTKVRGVSHDELMERGHEEHVAVHKVLHKHPEGGTFAEFQKWLGGRL